MYYKCFPAPGNTYLNIIPLISGIMLHRPPVFKLDIPNNKHGVFECKAVGRLVMAIVAVFSRIIIAVFQQIEKIMPLKIEFSKFEPGLALRINVKQQKQTYQPEEKQVEYGLLIFCDTDINWK